MRLRNCWKESRQKKQFFFEKKNPKTFTYWHTRPNSNWIAYAICKSFLVLFFKEELLAFLCGKSRRIAGDRKCRCGAAKLLDADFDCGQQRRRVCHQVRRNAVGVAL